MGLGLQLPVAFFDVDNPPEEYACEKPSGNSRDVEQRLKPYRERTIALPEDRSLIYRRNALREQIINVGYLQTRVRDKREQNSEHDPRDDIDDSFHEVIVAPCRYTDFCGIRVCLRYFSTRSSYSS